jgi:hypothetical protein
MGRNKAEKNGLAKPLWVRLPFLQDYQLRRLARGKRELGTVARMLILEALKAREEKSRNKAPKDIAGEIDRLRELG